MEKREYVSIAVIAVLFVVFAGAALFGKRLPIEPAAEPAQSIPASSETKKAAPDYGLDEVAAHNSDRSCWMAVGGNVYDVTSYIEKHPAGRETILSGCGKDSTEAFNGIHSVETKKLLENYFIGNLK